MKIINLNSMMRVISPGLLSKLKPENNLPPTKMKNSSWINNNMNIAIEKEKGPPLFVRAVAIEKRRENTRKTRWEKGFL
jgi:hypothetical protein